MSRFYGIHKYNNADTTIYAQKYYSKHRYNSHNHINTNVDAMIMK